MSGPTRVVIADDHPMIIEGLRAVLSSAPEFDLAGVATTGKDAVVAVDEHTPDIVVMDLHMPELDGVEATRAILAAHPHIAVLVLTMDDDDDLLVAAVEAGARGYLLKGSSYTDVLRALRSVASGEAVFGSGVAERVLRSLAGRERTPAPQRALVTVLFTDIVDSTRNLVERGDREWRHLLEEHDDAARRCVEEHGGRYVKSTGDGCVAIFPSPGRAVGCARLLREHAARLGVDVRAALHTGECELRNDDVGGIAVHLAARVLGIAAPGEILVTQTVCDVVAGSGLAFESRGAHELKGLSEAWPLHALAG